jgi:hypothetical protein
VSPEKTKVAHYLIDHVPGETMIEINNLMDQKGKDRWMSIIMDRGWESETFSVKADLSGVRLIRINCGPDCSKSGQKKVSGTFIFTKDLRKI